MIIKNLVKIKELNILKALYCYSLDFDGVNEYVNCTNNSAFDLDNADAFSVYAWINVTSYDPSATEHIVSKYSNPPAQGYFLAVQANKIVFSLQNNGGTNGIIVETVNTFNTGQWYNVVVTYDGSSSGSGVKIYVDSINEPTNVTADTLTGSILTSETLKIGGTVTPARYFNGKISSVRMWNTELLASEVLLEFYNSQSIVHPANLIVNTDINNSTFNGTEWDIPDLTGTTSGYQTVLMEVEDRVLDCPIPILPCNSLLFDGVAEYINCGNNTAFDLDGTDSYSISGWIKKTGATYFPILQKLFYPNVSTSDGYRVYIHPTLNVVIVNLFGAGTSAISVQTTNTISINTWLNITVTYNGSQTAAGVNIYINGILQTLIIGSDTYTGTMVNSENVTLGGQPTPTNPLYGTGNIASVRMWNVELTAGETLTEYNNGLSLASVQTSNLILNTDINNSIFNGSEWDIPDLTGITSGYQTVLMEVGDKVEGCPNVIASCYTLEFDGVNEYVDCGYNSIYNSIDYNLPFSFSVWCKANDLSGLQMLIAKRDPLSISGGLYLGFNANTIRWSLANPVPFASYTINTTSTFSVGVWYNITATFDGTDATGLNIYVDGVLQPITIDFNSAMSSIVSTIPVTFGAGLGEFFFNGSIAKSRIWKAELTSVQVAAEYNGGTILSSAVQGTDLILESDINNATFGTDWDIPDISGVSSGFTSVNMEVEDKTSDCPI